MLSWKLQKVKAKCHTGLDKLMPAVLVMKTNDYFSSKPHANYRKNNKQFYFLFFFGIKLEIIGDEQDFWCPAQSRFGLSHRYRA